MNDALETAIELLANAHGPDALRAAFRAVQRRVKAERRAEDSQTLGSVVMEAIRYRDKLKADGAAVEDLDAGVEAVIRARWPKPHDRTVPWRYVCEACGDTGLVMLQCKPGRRCSGISTRTDGPGDKPGKYTRLCVGSTTYEHDYGVACDCARGESFRPRQPQGEDDFRAAAKSKPRPMAKWGR